MIESIPPILDPPHLKEGMAFSSHSRYELIRRLGKGGMGEVWLANRISAGNHAQKVAIKFLFDAHASRQLAAEAMKMSQLNHDNIVPFVDSGRDEGGRYFVAMAYIRGMNLDGLRTLVGLLPESVWEGQCQYRIPEKMIGFVGFMVLRGLSHAHEYVFEDGSEGIVHRDVSPGNILIDEGKGSIKLTDFGVAAQQSTHTPQIEVVGKVPYMAPEILTEGCVDTRADLYSLGIALYELLTGFNPNVVITRDTNVLGAITSVMLAIERPLRPPHEVVKGVDETISNIIARMIETEPDGRYASAEEVIADLTYYLYSSGVGPNTSSLVSYIKMLKNKSLAPTRRDVNALPFLRAPDGEINIRPVFTLTDEALAEVQKQRSPGRVWD
jgi:eukaryotic-like serine/threonine-protein kinase